MLCVRSFNKTHYTLLFLKDFTSPKFDVQNYLVFLNQYYGYTKIEDWKLTPRHFRKRARINFLNPFVGFAFLTASLDYGWHGRTYGKLRWLKFGNIKFLPSFRFGLTPFGDEIYFESYFKTARPSNEKEIKHFAFTIDMAILYLKNQMDLVLKHLMPLIFQIK